MAAISNNLIFTGFRDQRYALNWRSYNIQDDVKKPNSEHGFVQNRKHTNEVFEITDWLELNLNMNQ